MKKSDLFLWTDFKSCPKKSARISGFWIFAILLVFWGLPLSSLAQDSYAGAADNGSAITGSVTGNIDQQRTVTGTVRDENGEPLPGATVQIAGTTTGTLTDVNGRFSLDVPSDAVSIMVSYVGYASQTIPVAGRATIDVSLVSTLESLDEIVVVGYGTQKRTTVTGSVSVVKGDEVAKIPVANITNAMAGKLAGVLTKQTSGEPGRDNADIYIRGVATTGETNPLIVIDGIIRDNINQLDPSTIESVTILKDAAAVAPYGMGGANGVVLITTKKGQEGLPVLTFNTYYGWQTPTYYPEVLDAVDYMKLRNEATLNQDPDAVLPFDPNNIANYASLHASDPDRYPWSNSRDLINFVIPIQKHDLQISGGTEKMKYFAGVGYYGQDGLFEAVNYHRFNANINLQAMVTNSTNITMQIIGSVERRNDLDCAFDSNRLFRGSYKFIPTEAIYFSNGLWGEFAGNSPVGMLNSGGYEYNDDNTILTTLSIEQQLTFIKGLSVKGSFSYDARESYDKGWHRPFYFYTIDLTTTPYTYTQSISTLEGNVPAYGYLEQTDSRSRRYTYQGFINYARTFGKHSVSGLVVAEARNNNYDLLYARRNKFAVDVDELNMGSSDKTDFDNRGESSEGAQIGYVYRATYDYDNKYILEASGRYDGHYYFAPGKRWGFFPAFSLGWRISEENFMQNISWLDNLKLRASWGKSGNLAGNAYQYLSGYTLYGNAYGFGTGTMYQGANVTTENNPNITWEVSQKTDVGFEASLWKDFLIVEADVFAEKRTGMLLSPSIVVPYEYGLRLAQENAGEMNNFGFELQAGTRKSFSNGLDLQIMGNVSFAKNKMIQIFESAATYDNPNRRQTGRPYGTVFGYESAGLFTTADDTNSDGIIDVNDGYNVEQFGELHPGDIRYVDQNGDNKISSDDEVVIGHPSNYPLMTFGINATATWKGFDISLFFQGSAMTSNRFDNNFVTIPFYNNNSNATYEYYNNRWTPENQDAKYPRCDPSPTPNNNGVRTDYWQWSTAYLRLKNGQIGYTLPKSVLNAMKISSIRIYVAAQNALTISNVKFLDPESGSFDVGYPLMTSYTIGANVTF